MTAPKTAAKETNKYREPQANLIEMTASRENSKMKRTMQMTKNKMACRVCYVSHKSHKSKQTFVNTASLVETMINALDK